MGGVGGGVGGVGGVGGGVGGFGGEVGGVKEKWLVEGVEWVLEWV